MKKILVATFIIITIGTSVSYAIDVQTTYTPLAPLPNISANAPLTLETSVSFQTYVTYAFNLLIAVAAVMAVFMITMGGFEYMTSDAVQKKSDGLEKVKNAIYGLLLVLSSYLILKTINPQFVSIPSTLVAPLNLNQKVNQISDWQTTMNIVSAQFQNQADNAIAAKTVAKAQVAAIQQQLSSAQNDAIVACGSLSSSVNTPECIAAQTKATNLQDQLNTANSNLAMVSYYANATGILNTCNSGGEGVNGPNGPNTNTFQQSDAATVQKCIDANIKLKNAALSAVNTNGGDAATIQKILQINTLTNASNSVDDIMLNVSTYTDPIQKLNLIINQASSTLSQTTDANVKDLAQTVITKAQANKIIVQKKIDQKKLLQDGVNNYTPASPN